MSSLTEGVLAQVVNYTSSHAVWCALDATFSSKSRARIVQIRTQLTTATKGIKSATEYFHFIKKLADELAIAGQPMTRDDTITYILAGLGHEYDSFVASISARTDSVTLEEIYSLLLTIEAHISRHQLTPAIQQPSANVAQRHSQPFARAGHGSSRGRGRGNHGGFNSANRNNDQLSIICQVCGIGHGTSTQPATNALDSDSAPHGNEQPAPTNTHSMITRSKNHIHKPKQQPDGCIRYPLPRALRAETTSQALEPT
ncbi:hypothetical protein F0562_027858 [Nyssa sinensis]|uniref:Retrotransposon gag domain-containing protein n=1 Tax=Nyssa sinensis TaxID=561372 RepID=A0A5J5B6F6_9ASTE|nr:hypothetical protein F0562_027858 [Nyssa sinensis]